MSIAALIIDSEQLQLQLERAEGAREEVDAVVDWLEQGVRLVEGPTPEPVAPIPPPVARHAPAEDAQVDVRRRGGQRDRDGKLLSALLKATGPRRLTELAEAAGLSEPQARESMKRLEADGKAARDGKGRSTRYRKVAQEGFHTEARAKAEASRAHGQSQADAGARRVVVRDRVMKAVAAEPGKHYEASLAKQLGFTETEVNQAVAYLLGKNRLTIDPATNTLGRQGQAAV